MKKIATAVLFSLGFTTAALSNCPQIQTTAVNATTTVQTNVTSGAKRTCIFDGSDSKCREWVAG